MSAGENVRTLEASCIGAGLICPQAMRDMEGLQPQHFASAEHRLIWQAMQAVWSGGDAPDIVTVRAELERRGMLKRAGGATTLAECARDVPSPNAAAGYARRVRQMWVDRRMAAHAASLHSAAASGDRSAVDEALSQIRALREEAVEGEAFSHISQLDAAGRNAGCGTSLELLGKATDGAGWICGQMGVVKALRKTGKTALMTQEAMHIAATRGPVAYCSVADLPERQLVRRMMIQTGWKPEDQGELTDEWRSQLDSWPLHIWRRRRGWCLEDLCLQLMELRHREPALAAAFIDYGQRIRTRQDFGRDRTAQLELISRELQDLAEDLGIPVIVGSQVNAEGRTKGAGAWEEDAGLMVTIGDPSDTVLSSERGLWRSIQVELNRFGPPSTPTDITFDGGPGGTLTFGGWTPGGEA